MQSLQVNLPGTGYPIRIGAGILAEQLRAMVGNLARELVVVVTNPTVDRLYPAVIPQALSGLPVRVETCLIPDGERFKTLETLSGIYDRLMELGANRQTVLIAFGGGVVGDVAGFAAGTFMRGIPLIQVPTTLLAQVDSSVGGKTAVNHPQGKNAIGVFQQPKGVVIELTCLATLPERELHAGLFELIKHGIIADRELFGFLETNTGRFAGQDWDFWEEAVLRSCRVKARVVEADEKESGLRATLNFGHTLGHLIETHTGYEAVLHGEAVGVGMLFAAFASKVWERLPAGDFARVNGLLGPLMMPAELPPLDERAFTELILHDKKAAQQTVRFVVLDGLGEVAIREKTTPAELWSLFRRFLDEHPEACRVRSA